MNRHPTQPMKVIVRVHRADKPATDRLVMECGHEIERPHRPLWGKRTSCDQCPGFAG